MCFSLYIILSLILQLAGLVYLIVGIAAAVASGNVVKEDKEGNLDFCY
jgi:hypothetical protein